MSLHEKMNEYPANQQVMYFKLHNLYYYQKLHWMLSAYLK
jgi:DNA-binding ferritin-like protein